MLVDAPGHSAPKRTPGTVAVPAPRAGGDFGAFVRALGPKPETEDTIGVRPQTPADPSEEEGDGQIRDATDEAAKGADQSLDQTIAQAIAQPIAPTASGRLAEVPHADSSTPGSGDRASGTATTSGSELGHDPAGGLVPAVDGAARGRTGLPFHGDPAMQAGPVLLAGPAGPAGQAAKGKAGQVPGPRRLVQVMPGPAQAAPDTQAGPEKTGPQGVDHTGDKGPLIANPMGAEPVQPPASGAMQGASGLVASDPRAGGTGLVQRPETHQDPAAAPLLSGKPGNFDKQGDTADRSRTSLAAPNEMKEETATTVPPRPEGAQTRVPVTPLQGSAQPPVPIGTVSEPAIIPSAIAMMPGLPADASLLSQMPVGAGMGGSPLDPGGPRSFVSVAPAPVQQVVQAAIRLGDGSVELRLEPEELGRITLSLVPEGERMRVLIMADRPETLELLRRHSPDLEKEFRALGYDSTDFRFSGEGQPPPSRFRSDRAIAVLAASAEGHVDLKPQPPHAPSHGRLDLRL